MRAGTRGERRGRRRSSLSNPGAVGSEGTRAPRRRGSLPPPPEPLGPLLAEPAKRAQEESAGGARTDEPEKKRKRGRRAQFWVPVQELPGPGGRRGRNSGLSGRTQVGGPTGRRQRRQERARGALGSGFNRRFNHGERAASGEWLPFPATRALLSGAAGGGSATDRVSEPGPPDRASQSRGARGLGPAPPRPRPRPPRRTRRPGLGGDAGRWEGFERAAGRGRARPDAWRGGRGSRASADTPSRVAAGAPGRGGPGRWRRGRAGPGDGELRGGRRKGPGRGERPWRRGLDCEPRSRGASCVVGRASDPNSGVECSHTGTRLKLLGSPICRSVVELPTVFSLTGERPVTFRDPSDSVIKISGHTD